MVIGLCGAKKAGKNTVANFIEEILADEYAVKQYGFADKLKLSAFRLFNPYATLEEAIEWADTFKENGEITANIIAGDFAVEGADLNGRTFFQRYGTEAHRDIFGKSFWVDALLDDIPTKEFGPHLITDIRFDNEITAIKEKFNSVVIKVRRPEVESSGDTHSSEIPIPDELVDFVIWNDGTLEQLKVETETLLKEIHLGNG